MSCVISVDIIFPEIGVGSPSLPLPFVDYGGQPVNSTIMSNDQAPPITRRSRWTRSYAGLGVTWVLTRAEFVVFREFFNDDLGNGIAWFQIPLRYPFNSTTTEWVARFASGYSAEHSDGYFTVQADLDLVNPVVDPIPEPS